MKQNRLLLFLLAFFCLVSHSKAQEEETDSTKIWTTSGSVGLNFSNVGLENWTGGGVSSISLGFVSQYKAVRETEETVWDNQIDFAYGLVKQKGNETFRKTDDQLIINSQFGKKFNKRWSVSASLNFRTQVAPAYNYSTDANGDEVRSPRISNLLAPGFLNTNIGLTYKYKKVLTATISPLANKTTFILDDGVDETAFGLEEGDEVRAEFGYAFTGNLNKKIMENVNFTTSIALFADYENPTEIDVNWETLLAMKVNKYITASFGTQLIYDEDVAIVVDETPRNSKVQFKHVLNIGFGITF